MDAMKERIFQLLTLDYVAGRLLPAACIALVAFLERPSKHLYSLPLL